MRDGSRHSGGWKADEVYVVRGDAQLRPEDRIGGTGSCEGLHAVLFEVHVQQPRQVAFVRVIAVEEWDELLKGLPTVRAVTRSYPQGLGARPGRVTERALRERRVFPEGAPNGFDRPRRF